MKRGGGGACGFLGYVYLLTGDVVARHHALGRWHAAGHHAAALLHGRGAAASPRQAA